MSSGANYFQQPAASSTKTGFGMNGSFYYPVIFPRDAIHVDIGIQDRLTSSSIAGTGSPLAMNTLNLGVRLEFWRFYVGAGYGVWDFVSTPGNGVASLRSYAGVHSYFTEGGVIWRVIPEFQIAAGVGLEFGTPSGGTSPAPSIDYGLHFRFPLFPGDEAKSKTVKFDGFRYPFGFMKD